MDLIVGLFSIVGVAVGFIFCGGTQGASRLATAIAYLRGSLSVATAKAGKGTHGAIFSLILALGLGLSWRHRVPGPAPMATSYKMITLTLLTCGLLSELTALAQFARGSYVRHKRLGVRDEQLFALRAFPSRTSLRISGAMSCVYALLLSVYGILLSDICFCFHEDPLRQRPINTLRYVEWSVAVPVMQLIVGSCLLERTGEMLWSPILQTVSYIWIAWAGQMVSQFWLRAILISSCFTIFAESALAQLRWARPGQLIESVLLVSQVAAFAIYGVIYLLGLAGVLSPDGEDGFYTLMDVTFKLGHTLAFIALHRAGEIDYFFRTIRTYLDMLVGLRALVGAQFDFLIHCRVSAHGLVICDVSPVLESMAHRVLKGQPLEDICYREEDRNRLRQHRTSRRTPMRPATTAGHSSSPWQRQEAISQVASMLRLDLAWASGSMPAELLMAGGGEASDGDIVVIGIRLVQSDAQCSQNSPREYADTMSDFSEWPALAPPCAPFHVSPATTKASTGAPAAEPAVEQSALAPTVVPPPAAAPGNAPGSVDEVCLGGSQCPDAEIANSSLDGEFLESFRRAQTPLSSSSCGASFPLSSGPFPTSSGSLIATPASTLNVLPLASAAGSSSFIGDNDDGQVSGTESESTIRATALVVSTES